MSLVKQNNNKCHRCTFFNKKNIECNLKLKQDENCEKYSYNGRFYILFSCSFFVLVFSLFVASEIVDYLQFNSNTEQTIIGLMFPSSIIFCSTIFEYILKKYE